MDVVAPLAGLMAAAVPLRENYFELSKQLEIMTMFRELNIYYVDEIQPGQLMETGMDAMVESLDPYTVYYLIAGGGLALHDHRRIRRDWRFHAIHQRPPPHRGRTPDFPAARAGLKIGDELLVIDGQSLEGMDPTSCRKLKAQAVPVDIQYRPNGAREPVDLTVERENQASGRSLPIRHRRQHGYVILSAFAKGSSFGSDKPSATSRTA